jgi:hypothetical protein
MVSMNKPDQKSNKIFRHNIKWLLSSDIRIKKGPNKGALYGWRNFNPVSFPFIYSEITGYGITAYLYIYSELRNANALQAAKDCSEWIIKNMKSYMLVARPRGSVRSEQTSNLYYAFDNGMIIIGLLHLYKMTLDANLLEMAKRMGEKIIRHFFDGTKLTARLDESYNPIVETINDGIVKWSTISGSYHSKLSIGLLELSRLTKNKLFKQVSNSICNYAISLQKSNGQFMTNPESDITYLHPHLYSCEGLIYSGLNQSIHSHYSAGLKGIKWAMEQTPSSANGGLRSNTGPDSVEQSDCTAQLLRLLILCRQQLEKFVDNSELDNVINKLHLQLFDFYIPSGHDQGGMRYQLNLDTACSWCTMFSMQALHLWKIRDSEKQKWIEYFV